MATPSAVSKRLRFEILRRDDHACRYCGAKAPDVALTVDHVVPVALGGRADPGNLVTACADCNSGKASANPDAASVENARGDAKKWAAALKVAAEQERAQAERAQETARKFNEFWRRKGYQASRPEDWRVGIEAIAAAGLELEDLERAFGIAKNAAIPHFVFWRYFCGACWRIIEDRQERARELLHGED